MSIFFFFFFFFWIFTVIITVIFQVIKRLLERQMMFLPKLNFAIVDVRDVAAAHIKAMTIQEASGKTN